jgi:hypothetical protein
MMILCIWAAVSFVAGWIWRLYHATGDGRLFNYPVLLSSEKCFTNFYCMQFLDVPDIPNEIIWDAPTLL